MTALVVVSGGIRESSSTRLLADQIEAAVRVELARANSPAATSVIELRPLGRAVMDAMLSGLVSTDLAAAFQLLA